MSPLLLFGWLVGALAAQGPAGAGGAAPGAPDLSASRLAMAGAAAAAAKGVLPAATARGAAAPPVVACGLLSMVEVRGPAAAGLRLLLRANQPLRPYLLGSIGGLPSRRASAAGRGAGAAALRPRQGRQLEVAGALGVAWFVVPSISIAADLGLRAAALRRASLAPLSAATLTSQLLGSLTW